MRVLVEALGIERPGGGRSATLSLVNGLTEADPDNEYVLLVSSPEPSLIAANLTQVVLPIRNRFASRLAAEAYVPALARRFRVDLIHHAKNLVTAVPNARRLATVYDLTILAHPELYPRSDVLYWRLVQPRLLGWLDRVVAISQTTARDLEMWYGLTPPSVTVVYPGYDPAFRPQHEARPWVVERYGLRPGYVLHVGSISRKKNLMPLARAIHRLADGGWKGQLALVGRVYDKGRDDELASFVEREGLQRTVVFTGPVPQSDLPDIYRSAGVFVFPSLHEGFGLVPVEAMACGIPVVASKGGALDEVIGGAAWLLADSSDDQEIAAAIQAVLDDGAARARLVGAGLERARQFTRRRSAERTLGVYRELLGS